MSPDVIKEVLIFAGICLGYALSFGAGWLSKLVLTDEKRVGQWTLAEFFATAAIASVIIGLSALVIAIVAAFAVVL